MANKSANSHAAQSAPCGYDDALLNANWNPVVELVDGRLTERRTGSRRRSVLSEADARKFLRRIYASGA